MTNNAVPQSRRQAVVGVGTVVVSLLTGACLVRALLAWLDFSEGATFRDWAHRPLWFAIGAAIALLVVPGLVRLVILRRPWSSSAAMATFRLVTLGLAIALLASSGVLTYQRLHPVPEMHALLNEQMARVPDAGPTVVDLNFDQQQAIVGTVGSHLAKADLCEVLQMDVAHVQSSYDSPCSQKRLTIDGKEVLLLLLDGDPASLQQVAVTYPYGDYASVVQVGVFPPTS